LGHVLVQYERRYAEGEKLYLTAIRLKDDDVPFWQRLAIVRAYLGRTDRALVDHSQLVGFLKVDPAIDALRSAPCYAKAERRLYELAQLAL
jgi:hypothetical protein